MVQRRKNDAKQIPKAKKKHMLLSIDCWRRILFVHRREGMLKSMSS